MTIAPTAAPALPEPAPSGADAALRASEQRFRTLFASMDEALCLIELVFDGAGRAVDYIFLETNPAFEIQSGLVDAVGKTILTLVPEFEASWFAIYAEVARTGTPLRFESEFKSMGYWFDVHVSRADAHGRLSILFKDITARKRIEVALLLSEERYRSLFESIDEGFCLIEVLDDAAGRTIDYRFLQVNPAFVEQTGLRHATGELATVLTPGLEQSWFDYFGRVAHTGEPVRFVLAAAGLARTFDVYASRAGGPGSACVAIVFTDITERKRAEDDLRRMAAELSEVDRRKNEFLATLAHELRNPLAPLSNGLSLVQRLRDDPPALSNAVDMMARQVQHMVRLVDDLLDVARISNGKVELKRTRVEVGAVLALAVESSMHLLADKQHTLHQRLDAAAVVLDIDGARIAQVVSNLLNNAAKYSPAGSPITLSAELSDGAVVIAVADRGIGIPANAQGSVFDMFSQVAHASAMAQGGLGIGLSLVRKLVELHGGTVAVTSAGVDCGSTFSVRLPLARAAARDEGIAGSANARAATPARARRILVVDDNTDAADTLAMLLDFAGHVTSVRYDGRAALAHAGEFRPDVIFLDIGLPGLNGYEVARAIKAQPALASTVLVALTGWGAEADRARAIDAGFDHHLTKPTQIDALTALIARIGATIDARSAASRD